MKRITALTLTTALALGGVALAAPAASAKPGSQKARGACTAEGGTTSATWAVQVKPRKGQLRTDFWVKGTPPGKVWDFAMYQNGVAVGPFIFQVAGASDNEQGFDDTLPSVSVKFRSQAPNVTGTLVVKATSGNETCTVTLKR